MLNGDERRRTRDELARNLARSGRSVDDLAADLGSTAERVRTTLELADADPVDVWRLRDHLEGLVRDAGREPVPWSVLTEAARQRARAWFRLRPAPPRP